MIESGIRALAEGVRCISYRNANPGSIAYELFFITLLLWLFMIALLLIYH